MYKIQIEKNYKLYIGAFVLSVIVLILFFLYLLILKKLEPLKNLHEKIIKFSNGDLGVKLHSPCNDEIGQIAKSFNEAIANINQLINSKNLFMKNILHELKTPITKGLFLTQMIQTQNKQDKKALINTFQSINTIINQLSNIEKLKNHSFNIHKTQIDLPKTFEKISLLLELDCDDITIQYNSTCAIIANSDLFFTMFKNLIENAVKYSSEKPVKVTVDQTHITVSSKGEKLSKELTYYTQAFVQETKNSQGFGLGLYIVQEIAALHKFKLLYEHTKGYNHFSIHFI